MNIKQKFLVAFGILLVLLAVAGVLMLRQVDQLGRTIDEMLRENYQSVIICQRVNEAMERIDSGLLLSLSGQSIDPGFFPAQTDIIRREWQNELRNITLPTEGERAERVEWMLPRYFALLSAINRENRPEEGMKRYREELSPLFHELKKEVGGILTLNQNNMAEANRLARLKSAQLFRQGIALLLGSFAFVLVLSLLLTNWIQRPLRQLIAMTNEIANGNLALALDSRSNDEIGQLSRSFNAMAIALRNAQNLLTTISSQSKDMSRSWSRQAVSNTQVSASVSAADGCVLQGLHN